MKMGKLLDETELFINLNINHNVSQSDLDNINIVSSLENQLQQQEMKDSGWRFDKINSMIVYFYKTSEMDGSNYIKIPLRSNAILNIETNDKYCFLWSILAYLHPCNNNHPNRVSNYKQYFNELNMNSFDFSRGFRCTDVHKFNELNNLSVNIFELNFYQDESQWKHNLIPIEVSENNSDKVIDLTIYKNHYILIKKLDVFLGDHNKKYFCTRCLSSYTSENVLIKHKEKCENNEITAIKTSNKPHLYWDKYFHKNPLYFRIYADFEADNEKDGSIIGNKTTNIYKQNPVLNGYYIVSELENVLKSSYYKSPFGYDNVDWFVDEVIKLENKMAFYFKNVKKDTQNQSNFIPFIFHNFSNYDCHMFFKKLVDKKKDKVDFDIIPKTSEEYISVTYGCIRFIDSYRFLTSSLDVLVKNLDENDFKILKKEFPDKWPYINKKLAYPYEYFNSIDDYKKSVHNLKNVNFFSKLKNKYPDNEEIQHMKEIINVFNIKNGVELTELYLKSDVILLADVVEKFIKISLEEYEINPLYCVSLPGYTWNCGLKYTEINLQTLQDKDMILLLENNIRGGISSVMGDRYIKSDEDNKIIYVDANNLYGYSMSEPLPYDEIKFDNSVKLEDILNTPDDSDIGYLIEVDLNYPDNIKEKTKHLPFAPVNKKNNPDNFSDYMKEIKPDTYIQTSKLICDWSDKKISDSL